jgi:Holliday junction resolvase RusA-like endonuclease
MIPAAQLPWLPPSELPAVDHRPIVIGVRGVPIPQGSMKAFVVGPPHARRAVVTPDNARTKPWKAAVTDMAGRVMERLGQRPLDGPVGVDVVFRMPRPKGHFGRRGLLPSAPATPATKPDIDKLARAILDALTGIVFRDDSQVVALRLAKVYADDPGATITIEAVR